MTAPWDFPGRNLPEPVIPVDRSFEGFLRLEWLALDDALARVRFAVRDELKQPLGLLHGGIYSAVAETVASVATVHAVWKDGFRASGMSNHASFLRPVTGGTLEAISRRRTAREDSFWLWTTDFLDEQRRTCAVVDVTVAVRPRRS